MKKKKVVNAERAQERKLAIQNAIKDIIVPLVILLIIGFGVYMIFTYKPPVDETEIIVPNAYDGEEEFYALENDKLRFVLDPITTQFEVTVKETGKVWRSNPAEADSDAIALPEEKKRLQSVLLMQYATQTGLKVDYNTFGFGVNNGIYEIEANTDTIKVKYSIGDIEREYFIPPVLTYDIFQEWMSKFSEADQQICKDYYKKYDINKLGKKDNKEELLENYPIIETEVIYVLRSGLKKGLKTKLEKLFEDNGYTYEQYLEDKELDKSLTVTDKPVFNISLIYRLEGDDLVVEMPFEEMEYKKTTPIYTITLLPYFGAGSKTEEGFMFVPEGGGAIINFNNEKTSQNSYYANMYGWDMALSRKDIVHNTRNYFNAFGVSDNNNAFVCTVDQGASYGSIQADISGRVNSFNYVNAIYSICQREQFDVGNVANSDIFEYLWELPKESIVHRYSFINSGSYADMAKDYQKYLMTTYPGALEKRGDNSAPAVIEVINAVDKVKQIVGIPVSRPLELTTFDETSQIMEELDAAGLKNMTLKLMGWANGGVNQKVLNRISLVSGLGGKKKLNSLTSEAQNLGVDVYLNGVSQYAYNSNLLNGFFSYTDAAKLISKERVELFKYSAVTYSEREGVARYFLLHTELAMKLARKLADEAAKYNAGVAFEDNGVDLSSDFYRKNFYSREAVKNLQTEHFAELKASGQNVMINMGNDYAAVYSDMITDMDLSGSEYTILDANVPFYQMALHGYVNYSGESLNICGNIEEELLNCAEYGAALKFTLMDETAFTLQDTLYTRYYGCEYNVWKDKIVDIYNKYNKELGHTFNQEMVGHEQVTGEVSCTKYADGTKVYVNYGYAPFTTSDGIVIPARDYKAIK